MQYNQEFPYPTFIELIRTFVGLLDIKHAQKTLDDKAYDKHVDPRKIKQLISECIQAPLEKRVGIQAAELVFKAFTSMCEDYAGLVGHLPADGLTRDEMLPILLNRFFKEHIIQLLNQAHIQLGGPTPVSLFFLSDNAVKVVLDWVKDNDEGWNDYLIALPKEKRDQLAAWARDSGDIPSSQSIQLLPDAAGAGKHKNVNWESIRFNLMAARGVEELKRIQKLQDFVDQLRLALWGAEESGCIEEDVGRIQSARQQEISFYISDIAKIQHELKRTAPKKLELRDELRECIDHTKTCLTSTSKGSLTSYWLDWHDARWHLLSGDLEGANKLYEQAFNDCLFRSGINQKEIIEEAMVVAASQMPPDKVFMKHLKWANTTFKYDIPSSTSEQPSNQFPETVEKWEINMWKGQFTRLFPKDGFFPGCYPDMGNTRIGPLFQSPDAIKPDLSRPDRRIKVGDTWKKTVPQLVWFTERGNFEAVKALLDAGASVDCSSDVGDTPILMALEALNVTKGSDDPLDERFFELLASYEHKPETMNKRTQKKRLLPIISAVKTGRPDIVQKTIDLGADPNGRGETDEQTPLNLCIKYIELSKDPDKVIQNQINRVPAVEDLDSLRRHTAGLLGHTLEDQKLFYEKVSSNKRHREIFNRLTALVIDGTGKNMCLDDLREIARILIEAGADVNAEHKVPLPGYTPLMLASELDERNLFELMLANGGDPSKCYSNPRDGRKVNCWDIAQSFKSIEVQAVLNTISPNCGTGAP